MNLFRANIIGDMKGAREIYKLLDKAGLINDKSLTKEKKRYDKTF